MSFRVVVHEICKLIWLKRILEELKVPYEKPMKLYNDNKSTISIAHNPIEHDRTRHVEIDCHFIKEKLEGDPVCTSYIPTEK